MKFKRYLNEEEIENIAIFLTSVNEGVYDPSIFKAIFLAGGPGSGKSFVAKKTTSGLGLRMVNSDTLFEKLAKQNKIDLSNMSFDGPDVEVRDKIRKKAKEITDRQLHTYIKGRIGVVIDGTGKSYEKIAKQRKRLANMGYDTFMVFVNTSLEVALERNNKRARTVPEQIVTKGWQEVQSNMGKFQTLFGSRNFRVVDNSVFTSDKNVFSDVWKEVMKFTKRPLESKVAKEWIKKALTAKKRK